MKHQYLVKNILTRLIIIFLFILVVSSVQALTKNPVSKLTSPNKQIRIITEIQNGTPVYSVWFNKNQIIRPSSLGLELALPFKGGFEIISKGKGKENSSWIPMYGENKVIPDQYNSLVIELKEKAEPHRLLNIEFRAYNEGFAFCYTIPDQPNPNNWVIKKELSEFRFIDQSEGYPIYRGEATFSKDAVPVKEIKAGACYPLTIDTKFGFASVLEAFVVNYPRLKFGKTTNGDLVTAIMGDAKISAPFSTPWRAVILGKNEGKLIENEHFVLNLNPVCELKDVSWIKSGKTISNEGTFPLKTVELKKMIDFAAENGFKYLQLDWGWYGTEVKWTAQQIDTFKTYMSSRLHNTNWEENAEANPFTVAKGWVPYGWQERWKNS
ncbi:MAG TPA: glycoside hydrolase family 97 N-terminal domain-containing protein, partial [Prolixibacteraceae bacterium]|nr:glycoside hydrolase family 97 N-terminal domain-containing protein [Prolixibacteraceae bacterium]